MRISETEIEAIKALAAKWFGNGSRVRLFGSRADMQAKGGDIDLHIVAGSSAAATLKNEIAFVLDLQDRIGDQKIDVIVRRADEAPMGIDLVAAERGLLL
jgi:predicted nucleotidyltransferase